VSNHSPFSAYRGLGGARFRSWLRRLPPVLAIAGLIGGCDTRGSGGWHEENTKLGPRIIQPGQPVPKGGGRYKVGEAYRVNGRVYLPRETRNYDETGIASWYGELFHGRRTANGEIYDMEALTAAHPTLPIPSYARVTNLHNGRSLIVRVNDRGPYAHGRIIDLSWATASLLSIERPGTARVQVEYLGPAPLNGDDNYERRALASQPWAGPRIAFAQSPAKAMRGRRWSPPDYSPTGDEMNPALGPVASNHRAPARAPAASATPISRGIEKRRERPMPATRFAPPSPTPATITAAEPPPIPPAVPFRNSPSIAAPLPQIERTGRPPIRAAVARIPAVERRAQARPLLSDAAPPAKAVSRPRRRPLAAAPYLGEKAAAPAYYVEAGIFPELPVAERLAEILKDIAPTSVEPVTHEGRPAHRIRLGPFPEGKTANAAAARIRAAGLASARLERGAGG
jgi:rare lipoprotein A